MLLCFLVARDGCKLLLFLLPVCSSGSDRHHGMKWGIALIVKVHEGYLDLDLYGLPHLYCVSWWWDEIQTVFSPEIPTAQVAYSLVPKLPPLHSPETNKKHKKPIKKRKKKKHKKLCWIGLWTDMSKCKLFLWRFQGQPLSLLQCKSTFQKCTEWEALGSRAWLFSFPPPRHLWSMQLNFPLVW